MKINLLNMSESQITRRTRKTPNQRYECAYGIPRRMLLHILNHFHKMCRRDQNVSSFRVLRVFCAFSDSDKKIMDFTQEIKPLTDVDGAGS